MNISLKTKDIFEYAIGESQYDAIEKVIDPKQYEVFDCGIYDNKARSFIKQSEEYEVYCAAVSHLRKRAKHMSREDVLKACEDIALIAPRTIKLAQ